MLRIETERRDHGVVVLRLASPERANALDPAGLRALIRAIEAEQEPSSGARCLVLTGTGSVFTAGADLAALGQVDPIELTNEVSDIVGALHRTLDDGRLPSVAAVNGVAVGGGVGLALLCDIVIAARSAKFVLSFARLGLVPDTGSTFALPRLIGEAHARAIAMLGDELPAATAAEWGLIHRCVDDEAFSAEVDRVATRLARGPAHVYRPIRAALAASRHNDFLQQVQLEAELQGQAIRSPEFREAAAAFLARSRKE